MALYKGYKLVGQFPQYDAWEVDHSGKAVELISEYGRFDEPDYIELWSKDKNYPDEWTFENEFEGRRFASVKEACATVDQARERTKTP